MQLKLKEMQDITREEDILAMSKHFDMLVINHTTKSGYSSLSETNYTKHRNWKHFERVWEVCRMKEWSTKLYLESQFDRCKYWTTGAQYPQPSTMYSVGAMRHFVSYLGNLNLKYKKDVGGSAKKKGKETVSLRQRILDEIVSSIDILNIYISGNTKYDDKAQYKALKIYQSWEEISPFYLYTIPWFPAVLSEVSDENMNAIRCREEFARLDASNSLQSLVKKAVSETEQFFNLPPNIDL
jgi:hypothetical protein